MIEKINNENNILNKHILPFFILLLFIFLNTVIVFDIYSENKEKEDVLRLHIVANSNTIEDQIIKFKVEDYIQNYINNQSTITNKEDVINKISKEANSLITGINNILYDNNVYYKSTINLGKIKYEEKRSQNLDMEKGCYDSIQVVLGNGEGKNIWSLIFPNEDTIDNISTLNSILPGIENLFENSPNTKNEEKVYTFKILEIIKKL